MTFIITLLIIAAIIFSIIFWCTENYEITGFLIFFISGCIFLYGLLVWYPRFECEQKVEPSGYECKWDFFAGCQIYLNGQWIPYEKWRVID